VPKPQVLVVDDEPGVRFGVRESLEGNGFEVTEAATCGEAEETFRQSGPEVVLLDYRLPDGSALDLLRRFKAIDSSVPLLVLTAYGSIELAVEAVKEGAEQFLTKPVDMPTLLVMLERLVENRRNRLRQAANEQTRSLHALNPFLGGSNAIRELAAHARSLLAAEGPVLILGETGSGKGVLARWLHDNGPRAREPFIDFNCAGLTPELVESELFGYEKGAFTGAATSKPGLLEVAHRGAVFLDEVADVDLRVQAKLLKVVEEQRFRRLGDVRDRRVRIRLLAATSRDLPALLQEGAFRRDLYFRISTFMLRIPALRERTEDIPLLAELLLTRCAAEMGRSDLALSPDALRALRSHSWPGDIRELRNVIERAVLLSRRGHLEARDLQFDSVPSAGAGYNLDLSLNELERQHIERVLAAEGGSVVRAAKRLQMPRSSLYQKMKRYGLTMSRS
jgi:DNA-binding NtrC family response regulator